MSIRIVSFTNFIVKDATLPWLEALGFLVLHGPDIADCDSGAERGDPNCRDDVLIKGNLPTAEGMS